MTRSIAATDDGAAERGAKACFVICPFGVGGSSERKRSDMLLEYLITPAVREHGYAVVRADLSAEPGIVTVHIIRHLIEDDLVVADITDRNPNVFYELAIRHAIRKPFIQLIHRDQKIPFNIQGIQTIAYDLQDVDSIKISLDQMRNQISYYEQTGKVTSPVSVAIDSLAATSTTEQFGMILQRLGELDKSVVLVEELKRQIIVEVQSILAEIRDHVAFQPPQSARTRFDLLENLWVDLSKAEQRHSGNADPLSPLDFLRNTYNVQQDDPESSPIQREQRRSRGEYTIGEWIERERTRREASGDW